MAARGVALVVPLYFFLASCRILLEWTLLELGVLRLSLPFIFDVYSFSFSLSVILIAGAVLVFSSSYINNEKFFTRFHLLVFSFVVRIILLIFSPNMISLLLGWDGLGVTSYLLVIYFFSHKSLNAGLLTALTNRIGDCLFLISIAIFINKISINLFILNSLRFKFSIVMGIVVIVAASTKRAQLPFSAWLPAAIAAPTPVSSLVHSSTLVTAGVYVLFRFSQRISSRSLVIIILIGCLTIRLASLAALSEIDIKKIVALSTLSQLGLIITTMGAGGSRLAFFHLLSHAYFKALLFIRVGNLIHLSSGVQDLRILFTGKSRTTLTPRVALLANLRLIGAPFMTGFYSKDLILERRVLDSYSLLFILLLLRSVALTAAYRIRFIVLVSWKSDPKLPSLLISDNDNKMFYAMSLLAPFAIFGGRILSWTIIVSPQIPIIDSTIKIFILAIIIGGAYAGARSPQHKVNNKFWWWALSRMWALPLLSGKTNNKFLFWRASFYSWADLKWVVHSMLSLISKVPLLGRRFLSGMVSVSTTILSVVILFLIFVVY